MSSVLVIRAGAWIAESDSGGVFVSGSAWLALLFMAGQVLVILYGIHTYIRMGREDRQRSEK